MKKNIVLCITFLLLSSCNLFKTTQAIANKDVVDQIESEEIDPSISRFIGNYNMTAVGLPGSDNEFSIRVFLEGKNLDSTFTGDAAELAEAELIIESTEVEEDILFIKIRVPNYGDLTGYIEIYLEEDKISGFFFDRFELIGTKID